MPPPPPPPPPPGAPRGVLCEYIVGKLAICDSYQPFGFRQPEYGGTTGWMIDINSYLDQAKEDVSVQRAFVGLVNHHHAVARQVRFPKELSQQHACRQNNLYLSPMLLTCSSEFVDHFNETRRNVQHVSPMLLTCSRREAVYHLNEICRTAASARLIFKALK